MALELPSPGGLEGFQFIPGGIAGQISVGVDPRDKHHRAKAHPLENRVGLLQTVESTVVESDDQWILWQRLFRS